MQISGKFKTSCTIQRTDRVPSTRQKSALAPQFLAIAFQQGAYATTRWDSRTFFPYRSHGYRPTATPSQAEEIPIRSTPLLYLCRHTFTAEISRISASIGSKKKLGVSPSNIPPIADPRSDPAAMVRTKALLPLSTAKLPSRL